jgi:alpha-tubulin suppressor-like RCC1 family protein
VESIAAGFDHILFKKTDGSLWGMGNNGYGQLGLGEKVNHSTQIIKAILSKVMAAYGRWA